MMTPNQIAAAMAYNDRRGVGSPGDYVRMTRAFQVAAGIGADGKHGPGTEAKLVALLGERPRLAPNLVGWVKPMPATWQGRKLRMTSGFAKDGRGPNKSRHNHLGCDFMYRRRLPGRAKHPHYTRWHWCPDGVPFYSVGPGVVTYADWRRDRFIVVVDHGEIAGIGHLRTWNSHAKELTVERGDVVKAGDTLGIVGKTGTDIVHLHHGWLVGRPVPGKRWSHGYKAMSIDPWPYLKRMNALAGPLG